MARLSDARWWRRRPACWRCGDDDEGRCNQVAAAREGRGRVRRAGADRGDGEGRHLQGRIGVARFSSRARREGGGAARKNEKGRERGCTSREAELRRHGGGALPPPAREGRCDSRDPAGVCVGG